jgi:hypothetical protein
MIYLFAGRTEFTAETPRRGEIQIQKLTGAEEAEDAENA